MYGNNNGLYIFLKKVYHYTFKKIHEGLSGCFSTCSFPDSGEERESACFKHFSDNWATQVCIRRSGGINEDERHGKWRQYTISVKLKYNGAWIKQSYSIREPRKELELSCYRNNFDGKNDMTLCLDTSEFEMKYDEIKLYYENNDNDKVVIDSKNYSVKNGNNAIYYTIPATYLETLFEASNTNDIYICCCCKRWK